MIVVSKANTLLKHKQISHGFFGVPKGEPLNFKTPEEKGIYTPYHAQKALDALGEAHAPLICLNQTHGATIHTVTENFLKTYDATHPPEGDGLVTTLPHVVLGVQTADCGALLWYEKKQGIIAATHAGWRGALHGVLEATWETIKAYGGRQEHLSIGIGPLITKDHYEVSLEFKNDFLRTDNSFIRFFSENKGKTHFHLPEFLLDKLKKMGITKVSWTQENTYTTQFFSRRRALHKGQNYGFNYSLIKKIA